MAVLRSFAMRPLPGLRLTVVSRELHTPYSGMLPGLIAGHYDFDDTHIDLGPLAAAAGARLIADEAVDLEPDLRRVRLRSGRYLRYDLLSVNCGISPDLQGIEDVDGQVLPVKPISRLLPALEPILGAIDGGQPRRLMVVGGGAGGSELALALAWRLRNREVTISLATADATLVPRFNAGARRAVEAACDRAGIEVLREFRVARVEAGEVFSADGRRVPVDTVLSSTQAAAPAWFRNSGLDLDEDGFLAVGRSLQSCSHPEIFAAGDAVTLTF